MDQRNKEELIMSLNGLVAQLKDIIGDLESFGHPVTQRDKDFLIRTYLAFFHITLDLSNLR